MNLIPYAPVVAELHSWRWRDQGHVPVVFQVTLPNIPQLKPANFTTAKRFGLSVRGMRMRLRTYCAEQARASQCVMHQHGRRL